MLLAFDAHYTADGSRLAAAVFTDWPDSEATEIRIWESGPAAPYQPGEFYKRELPLILRALEDFDLSTLEAIIIDGYVYLDDQGRPGLGGHLYEELNSNIPVVGVAKSYFRDNNAEAVLRGQSSKPLYVTALGLSAGAAALHVREMAGAYRMPDILAAVDRATKA
ncbi:endonuclease V [Neolewinella aurantiaca]|uniref:Endonuclease V n=1 Tax=Neolewinella aurantiaca TaxID=2602767 RepID=A0A5C7F574_9BACT|nr:endonuclease V [Neolewinella aurantiaca]